MTIEEVLTEKHGCLLTLATLAKVLERSPEGLRISLRSTNSNEWSRRLNSARIKIGRRVYFRTSEVAQILEGK
jgi:hypothetical protein